MILSWTVLSLTLISILEYYLCCSGGVSQWMTCLDNIRNIPRPIYAKKIKFLEACLVADILHAQPNNSLGKYCLILFSSKISELSMAKTII